MEPNWDKQKVVTDERLAQGLINGGEEVAKHYVLSTVFPDGFAGVQQVVDSMVYAYVLAALFFPAEYFGGRSPKDIVYLAMNIRFGMDVETFATSILGG